MKALLYRKSIPRYALLRLLGGRFRGTHATRVAPISLVDVPEPKLPGPHWARVRPKLAGICGSDLATICAKGSPYLAPVTSMPFVMGHEVVGTVIETGREVSRVRSGDRVVLHPALGCVVRGIEPKCDACAQGSDALCRNITRGIISAGIQTGYCRDTGGGFGDSLVAHESQLYRIPDELDDRAAVLIEPFACALHGVLRVSPGEGQTVLVIGCGSIGLLTIAALRSSGCKARIVAVARYDHQRQLARELGADELLEGPRGVRERYVAWAKRLDAEVIEPELGKPMVIGGANAVFDCAATSQSIDDGIRFTKSGGTFALVGMPGVPRGVDWTPIWFKELTIRAAYSYGPERCPTGVRDTFDLAIEHIRTWGMRLSPLVGRPFDLKDYRAAFACALNTGRSGVVKTVFAF